MDLKLYQFYPIQTISIFDLVCTYIFLNYQAFFLIGLRQFLAFIDPYLHAKKSNEPIFRNGQTDRLTARTEFRGLSRLTRGSKKMNPYDCKNLVPNSFFHVMNSHPTFKVISTPYLFSWTFAAFRNIYPIFGRAQTTC